MFKTKEGFKAEFEKRLLEKYGRSVAECHKTEAYDVLGEMVRDYAGASWRNCREDVMNNGKRQAIYFSMEFLIGRLMLNNMQNLGIYKIVKEGLADLGMDVNELEDMEPDAGLGNGGLGRLAACFLDSAASLGYPVHGNTIRYQYGFFRQKFVDGKQTELPDQWLSNGFVFEVRKPKHAVEVQFGGNVETYMKDSGEYAMRLVNARSVRAVPYDVSVVGYKNGVANTLRLWNAEPSEKNLPDDIDFTDYLRDLQELSFGLYPDDSTEHGRMLRLRQQYFLVSAGLQSCMRGHLRRFGTLKNFADYYVFQLNDTHPILAIPEMMRLLMDEYGFGWDEAWETVRKSIAYTNHTVMPEALERWPINYVQRLLPRIYTIIEEINRRFNAFMADKNIDPSIRYQLAIMKDGQIHMTNMAIYAGFSVNGVAKIHTDILKNYTFKHFYQLFPEKFNSKTNGVTHRRWLLYSNEALSELITSRIGEGWIKNPDLLENLKKFEDDGETLDKLAEVKHLNKVKLASFFKDAYGIEVDPNSMFDVQIKRLHAYKRQLLNVFHIMYLYQKCKANPESFDMVPHTYIFGAKAAPSYGYAKTIIQLINAVAEVINADEGASKFMKIVFVENYGVSLAERIIPAADISEQISTAGKEASGTSNMKLMMNGALTLGTLDGANIEIADRAGRENEFIFGLTADEVQKVYDERNYNPWDVYHSDQRVKDVIDSLFVGPWAIKNGDAFRPIFDEVMNRGDQYLILKDFASYVEACERSEAMYRDQRKWCKAALNNIALSGFFSSDRTIEQYNEEIWHLSKMGGMKQ